MQALDFSRRHHLDNIDVERLISDDAFESAIFVLEGFYLSDIANFHAPNFAFKA